MSHKECTNEGNPFRSTASIENLKIRAEIIQQVRSHFHAHGFFHVETPVLSHDTVVDRYLDPIGVSKQAVTGTDRPLEPQNVWLQTSPEFGMKRILASGAEAIYQITRAFRAEESGPRHNPEFTMLEWYRTGETMEEAITFLAELAETILKRSNTQKLTYREAFQKYANVDPFDATESELRSVLADNQIALDDDFQTDRDGWLNLLLGTVIEPKLGFPEPVVIYDWPASQSALAIVREGSPRLAERFELYVDGFELANGYHELLDAEELKRRNQTNNELRISDGKEPLPVESRMLDAMRSGLPNCCGVALGIDRLVMVALGASSIRDVMAFPFDIA